MCWRFLCASCNQRGYPKGNHQSNPTVIPRKALPTTGVRNTTMPLTFYGLKLQLSSKIYKKPLGLLLNARCFQFGRLSKTDRQVPGHESSCLQCHCFLPWACSARVPTTSDMGQTVKLQSHFKSTKKESNIVQPLKNRKLYSRSGSKMVKQNPEEPRGTTSVLLELWHRRSTSLSLLAVRAPLTAEKWGLGPREPIGRWKEVVLKFTF